MTIKGLHEFLKKKIPQCVHTEYDMNNLRGKIIAVDAFYYIYKYIYTAKDQVLDKTNLLYEEPNIQEINKILMSMCLNGITKIMNFGIIPYFIFDGKPPPEKEALKIERRRKSEEAKEEIKRIRATIQVEFMINNTEMLGTLRKLYDDMSYINTEFVDDFKTILTESCINYMQAPCEAEKMCSYLCKNGVVAAVLSTDGDNLCYGCPFMIKETKGKYTLYCYQEIIKTLDINELQFRDICIMAECDYNKNIPGIGIGFAYKFIKEVGCIENLNKKYDTTCLNYRRMREIFSYDYEGDFKEVSFNTSISFNNFENMDVINNYAIMSRVNTVRSLLQNFVIQNNQNC